MRKDVEIDFQCIKDKDSQRGVFGLWQMAAEKNMNDIYLLFADPLPPSPSSLSLSQE